jgi:RNA polymerase sigma-70 factor (ECF subfamily)
MLLDENELLQGAQRWDLDALGKIYDAYSPGLYRYAWRLLGDVQLAEDCVSVTFERFLQALQNGRGPRNHLQAYLYRIAHNWVTDHYRKKQPTTISLEDHELEDDHPLPETCVNTRQQQEMVRNALNQLPPDQGLVMSLKYLEGWESEQIASALERSIGAVKALQHRATAALRKKIEFSETAHE